MADAKVESLKRTLRDQGQSIAWLAREIGYTRSYLSSVLAGRYPLAPELQKKIIQALDTEPVVTEFYRGQVLRMPQSAYRRAIEHYTADTTEPFEAAWKESWVREHAAEVLATAAERAWREAEAA